MLSVFVAAVIIVIVIDFPGSIEFKRPPGVSPAVLYSVKQSSAYEYIVVISWWSPSIIQNKNTEKLTLLAKI